MTALTADLCAAAIVASARSYGDNPVEALTAPRVERALGRRCLTPAALAIVQATGCSRPALCKLLSIDYYGLSNVAKKPATRTAWVAALAALGMTPDDVPASKFGPKPKATGTVVAPPPVAPEPPSIPAPRAEPHDHTALIRDALARRSKAAPMIVVGVQPPTAEGCRWPIGDPAAPDFRRCEVEVVAGRNYCAAHCKAAGQKPVPKAIPTVGRVVRPYTAREDD